MPLIANPPSTVPVGLKEAIESSGHFVSAGPDGWSVDNVEAVQAIINGYSGGADELTYWKNLCQAKLDAEFDANFDLAKFIRGGTSTSITATNVGNFLAQITNNYRSLRASIANATTVAAVQAISITSGWPANP